MKTLLKLFGFLKPLLRRNKKLRKFMPMLEQLERSSRQTQRGRRRF